MHSWPSFTLSTVRQVKQHSRWCAVHSKHSSATRWMINVPSLISRSGSRYWANNQYRSRHSQCVVNWSACTTCSLYSGYQRLNSGNNYKSSWKVIYNDAEISRKFLLMYWGSCHGGCTFDANLNQPWCYWREGSPPLPVYSWETTSSWAVDTTDSVYRCWSISSRHTTVIYRVSSELRYTISWPDYTGFPLQRTMNLRPNT